MRKPDTKDYISVIICVVTFVATIAFWIKVDA